MLPAPTTIATSTPRPRTSPTWFAIRSICAGSVPYSRSPISASPESFSRTRLKLAEAIRRLLLSHLEAGEARDPDVLAGLGGELGAQVLDRLALVALLVEVLLIEQDQLGGPLAELPLDDFPDDVLRLAVGLRLFLEEGALLRDLLLGDVLEGHVPWVHRGDVDRYLAGELLEVLIARDEVRLALDLDQGALAAIRVDVGRDDPLGGAAHAPLRRRGGALLAEDRDRLLGVALRLLESLLHVHHRRAGPLAKGLHVGRGDRHQDPPPWVCAGSGVGSGCSEVSAGCGAVGSVGSASPPACGAGSGGDSPLASACALASASALAFASASRLAFSSSSRRLRSSSSLRLRSSSSARRRSSSARHWAAAPSIAAPRVLITSSQERIASSLPGIT